MTAPTKEKPPQVPAADRAPTRTSTALAVQNVGGAVVPMPSNFGEMQEMARYMAQAGNMVGRAFRGNAGACLAILTQAMRWNMDPFAVSLKAYVADRDGVGPVAFEAQLVHAIVLKNAPLSKRPRCTYSGEGMDRRCKVVFHVIGEDEPLEYESPALEKIKKQSPLWKDDPDQQLWYYSVRAGARRHFPDVLMGVYTQEEMAGVQQTGGGATVEGGTISLSGDIDQGEAEASQDNVQEADFTSVDVLLQNKAAAQVTSPDGGEDGESRETPPADSTEASAAGAENGAAAADADSEDDPPADDEILKGIEKLKPAAKGKAVNEALGALRRIAETGEDALAKRAAALLSTFGPKG